MEMQHDVRALRHVFGMRRDSPQVSDFSKHHHSESFKELPPATGPFPFRFDLEDIISRPAVEEIERAGQMVFHAVGDTGNKSHGAEAQESVALHMEKQLAAPGAERPVFFYHLGDVVYYNGEAGSYEPQFYDPYLHYVAPIVAIPGNHDGDTVPDGAPSLKAFVDNFCAAQPLHTWMAGHSNRTTMTQPNVYWTLMSPLVTIIGLYSNVNGHLDKSSTRQQDWLVHELTAARERGDKCVIVTVHHPPYSLDDTHGGHQPIADALERAFRSSGRTPEMVLTGHVHNYQRFTHTFDGKKVPYIVAGAGGFAGFSTLHRLKTTQHPNPTVKLEKHNTDLPGFLRIKVTRTHLHSEYYTVPARPKHLTGTAKLFDAMPPIAL